MDVHAHADTFSPPRETKTWKQRVTSLRRNRRFRKLCFVIPATTVSLFMVVGSVFACDVILSFLPKDPGFPQGSSLLPLQQGEQGPHLLTSQHHPTPHRQNKQVASGKLWKAFMDAWHNSTVNATQSPTTVAHSPSSPSLPPSISARPVPTALPTAMPTARPMSLQPTLRMTVWPTAVPTREPTTSSSNTKPSDTLKKEVKHIVRHINHRLWKALRSKHGQKAKAPPAAPKPAPVEHHMPRLHRRKTEPFRTFHEAKRKAREKAKNLVSKKLYVGQRFAANWKQSVKDFYHGLEGGTYHGVHVPPSSPLYPHQPLAGQGEDGPEPV